MSRHEELKDLESNLQWIIEYADDLDSYRERLGDDKAIFLEDRMYQDCCRAKINDIAQCLIRLNDHHPDIYKQFFKDVVGGTVGMRNITIHEYEVTDYSVLWGFMKDELPVIVDRCYDALSSLDSPAGSPDFKPRHRGWFSRRRFR